MIICKSPEELVPCMYPNIRCLAFLAGGISNTPDWQQEFLSTLSNSIDNTWVMFNPRRLVFDTTDPKMISNQIQWESKYLHMADVVVFWFSPETNCPITLFELGVAAARNQSMIVGCHHNYIHKHNIVEQLSILRPEVHVRTSLDGVELDVLRLFRNIQQLRSDE